MPLGNPRIQAVSSRAGEPRNEDRSSAASGAVTESRFVADPLAAPLRFAAPPTVWLLDEPECEPYERFVEHEPAATLYHTLAWRDALLESGVGRPLYLMAQAGERVIGVLPLFEVRGDRADAAARLVSLPATPAAGVLAVDDTVRALLRSRALTFAESRGVDEPTLIEFTPRNADGWIDRPPYWVRFPIEALASMPVSANDQKPAAAMRTVPLSDEVLRSLGARAKGTAEASILTPLSHLAQSPTKLECVVTAGEHDDVNAAAVWLVHGAHLHVAACGPAVISSAVRARLLSHVAQLGRERGARWIDFAFPAAPDFHFLRLLSVSEVQVAVERRLSLKQTASL